MRKVDEVSGALALRHKRIVSLSIALLRAEAARESWYQLAQAENLDAKTDEVLKADLMRSAVEVTSNNLRRAVGLLALFLASIYAVAEKWQEWHFKHPSVDTLLANREYLRTLKQHRHAVFHAEMFDDKRLVAFGSNNGVIKWSMILAVTFRKALEEESKKLPPWPGPPHATS